jgi:tetratricopeptide (TPR) repeat protein
VLKDPNLRYVRKNLDEHVSQARAAMHSLRWKDAVNLWKDIVLVHPAPVASGYMTEYIRSLRMANNIKQAEKLAAIDLSSHPEDRSLLIEYAELASAEKKWSIAAIRWQRVLDVYDNSDVPVKVWQRLASSKRRLNDYVSALSIVSDGLKQHPDSIELLTERARILTKTEKWSLAVKDWGTVVIKSPTTEAYCELYSCLRELGKLSQAAETLKKAVLLFPDSLELKLEEAKLLIDQELWSKSLRSWQQAKLLTSLDTPMKIIQQIRLHISILKRLVDINSYKASIRNYQESNRIRKYVIYTSFSNGYDQLKLPEKPDPSFDYVVFTDADLDGSGIFQVRPLPAEHKDMRVATRYPKMHPHILFPNYEAAIWMDASIMITGDIMPMVKSFLASGLPIGCGVHPQRQNIQQELKACIRLGKDNPEIMKKQVAAYRKEGFRGDELSENGLLLFRPKDKKIALAMENWWQQVNTYSKRDQLSFNYSLWKTGVKWHKISQPPQSLLTNPDVVLMPHNQTYAVIDALQKQLS